MTITMTDEDLATIAQEVDGGWPYVRAPRLFDLDYALAASAAIEGREGDLDGWHEVANWTYDVVTAYWLLAQEHHNEAYASSILTALDGHFQPGAGLLGTAVEDLDCEDYEGVLGALRMIRLLQADVDEDDA